MRKNRRYVKNMRREVIHKEQVYYENKKVYAIYYRKINTIYYNSWFDNDFKLILVK